MAAAACAALLFALLAAAGARAEVEFGPREVVSASSGVARVLAVDVDADGFVDTVVASAEDGAVSWYRNLDAEGGGVGERRVVAVNGSVGICAADLDGDGRADLIAASDGAVAWCRNEGGRFGAQQVVSTALSGALSAVDVDADGLLDLVVASREGTVAWFRNELAGGGGFGAPQTVAEEAGNATAVAAFDADNDGRADVLVASSGGVAWYRNNRDGSFGVLRSSAGTQAAASARPT